MLVRDREDDLEDPVDERDTMREEDTMSVGQMMNIPIDTPGPTLK